MKKIIFTIALLVQVGFAMADTKVSMIAQVRHNNVKMFQQAGTSTPVLEIISITDRVEFIRRHNEQWALVAINGKAGYVLLSELVNLKREKSGAKIHL
jgi:hypothetical protein